MLKMYLRIVGSISGLCVLFGFLLPALFSARSTTTVILGIVIILALPVAAFRWKEIIISDAKALNNLFTNKKDKR